MQIKEKYGSLRLYYCSLPEDLYNEVEAWENKYVNLSEKICINCGKPATHMTTGWINYICEDCLKAYKGFAVPIEDIEIFHKDPEKYIKNKNNIV